MRSIVIPGLLLAAALPAGADVNVASIFTDNAVLQQRVAVPVWGTAEPGEKVTVEFAGRKKTATTTAAGQWKVELPSMKASAEPRSLTIAGNNAITLTNILVGEVWICSGQSNMEWPLSRASNAVAAAGQSDDPLLRVFLVQKNAADAIQTAVTGAWQSAASNALWGFSAVGYFFGRDLRAARGVPVGLIGTYWGGTPAEAWTRRDLLEADPVLNTYVTNFNHQIATWDPQKARQNYETQRAKWSNDVAKARSAGQPLPNAPRAPQDPKTSPHRPSCLYNGMIAPLVPYAIRGATWYQGESNAGRAREYETLLPTMIGNWRDDFGVGSFPFLIVQIATYQGQPPTIREAQLHIEQNTKNVATIVSADWGDEKDIHPTHKEPIGGRLALAARQLAYDEDVEYSGPRLRRFKTDGAKAMLTFNRITGGSLEARGGALKNFVIAEAGTSNFVPAVAQLEGKDKVIVEAATVTNPGAVRYGWTNYFVPDLFDASGLPASPFRTDDR